MPVVRLSELPLRPPVSLHFSAMRTGVFSGALVPVGSGAVIIENDVHELVRRRSTVGHEMAHVVCEHRFTTRLVNDQGCRVGDDAQEAEATEVGAELLLPFEAAKRLARRGASDIEVALQFGVSVQFARWRMDATGARLIARRTAASYRRGRTA